MPAGWAVAETGSNTASFRYRYRVGNMVIFLALLVAAAQLFNLQVPQAASLRAQAASQLKVTDVEKAGGAIVDRNFDKLSFTTEARALTFQPTRIRRQLTEARQKSPAAPDPDTRLAEIARDVSAKPQQHPDAATLLKKLGAATKPSSTWPAPSTPPSPTQSPKVP